MLFFQCLGTLNNVQKNLNKIGSKYSRIAAVWKKGISHKYTVQWNPGCLKPPREKETSLKNQIVLDRNWA